MNTSPLKYFPSHLPAFVQITVLVLFYGLEIPFRRTRLISAFLTIQKTLACFCLTSLLCSFLSEKVKTNKTDVIWTLTYVWRAPSCFWDLHALCAHLSFLGTFVSLSGSKYCKKYAWWHCWSQNKRTKAQNSVVWGDLAPSLKHWQTHIVIYKRRWPKQKRYFT